jgi:hypothetical protein
MGTLASGGDHGGLLTCCRRWGKVRVTGVAMVSHTEHRRRTTGALAVANVPQRLSGSCPQSHWSVRVAEGRRRGDGGRFVWENGHTHIPVSARSASGSRRTGGTPQRLHGLLIPVSRHGGEASRRSGGGSGSVPQRLHGLLIPVSRHGGEATEWRREWGRSSSESGVGARRMGGDE